MTEHNFIAGSGGGGKGGGNSSKTEADSLDSRSHAKIIDVLSEGQIEGLYNHNNVPNNNAWQRSIFLNDTPVMNSDGSLNFDDVQLHVRSGIATQGAVPGFQAEASSPNAVNQDVVHGTNGSGSGVSFQITDTSVDIVTITIGVPVLQKIKKNGDTEGTSFRYTIEKQQGSGAFAIIPEFAVTNDDGDVIGKEIKGRTPDLYQQQHDFRIEGNTFPVTFRIKRKTTDDSDLDLDDLDLISHQSIFRVVSYQEIKEGLRNQNATYTQSGQVITITSSDHNLIVGDSVKLTFKTGNPSKPTDNINATQVTEIVNKNQFKVSTSVSQTINAGTVDLRQIFNYPNSALVGMRIDAEQFSSIPKRAFRVRGTKVRIPASNGTGTVTVDSNTGRIIYPDNYVFNGTLQAARWTTDPAWCLYDLLTSRRYGLGDEILTDAEKANFSTGVASNLDIYSFYATSQYCSELVEFKVRLNDGTVNTVTEPRFSLNVVINKREDAFKVINNLCSVFRGMAMYTAGKLSLLQDRKGQDTSFLFTLANVGTDGFQYSSSSIKTRTTVAVVKYLDVTLRDTAYEEVLDETAISKYGVNTKNIDAFGVTSRYQARRLGRWFLYSLANETETVAFTTALEAAALCRPGQIIEIADPVRAGVRRAGRIIAVNGTNQITVDDTEITDLPTTGTATRRLHVIMPNGTVSTNIISTISGGTITVLGNFAQKIQDSNNNTDNYFLSTTNSSYNFNEEDYIPTTQTIAPNVNSIWILETFDGTSAENIETQKFKVVSVEEKDDFQYLITAITHNESKYEFAEQLKTLDFRDFTNLNEIPAPPPRFAERPNPDGTTTKYPIELLYRFKDTIRIKIIVGWQPVLGVNRYEVKYKQDSGNTKTAVVNGSDFEIPDVIIDSSNKQSRFDFEVRSINAAGVRSATPLTTKTQTYLEKDPTTGDYFFKAVGKSAPPSDITGFSGEIDPHLGVLLSWTAPTPTPPNFADLDIEQYEIKSGSWSTGTSLGKIKGTTFKVGTIPTGTTSQIFSIKAFDADGNQSVNAAQISLTITAPSAPQNGEGIFSDDNLILKWEAPASGSYAIEEYEIYQGNITDANLLGKSKSTTFQLPVNFNSNQTFNIRAVDIAGNNGEVLNFTVDFVLAQAPNINYQYENSQLKLFWSVPTVGSTKIKEYEIKQSATSVTDAGLATFITRVSSTSFLLDVTWNTSQRFWVAAVNSNGDIQTFGRTGIENYPDVSFDVPPAPTGLEAVLVDESARISWSPVTKTANGLPIADYKIYRSAGTQSFAQSVLVAQQNGTQITEKWIKDVIGGVVQTQKTYYIRALDINGNEGTLNDITITANPPSNILATDIQSEVVDNNVLLRWSAPSSDLPIIYYNIYRTSKTLGNLIGAKQGGFTTVFEQVGGTFTYIITAVNSAKIEAVGGEGKPVIVDEPPDFVLNAERNTAILSGTVTATYSQSNDTNTGAGIVVTVTKINHGLSNNQQLNINFTSGGANGTADDNKIYVTKEVTQNTFKFEVANQRQTTGNISYSGTGTFTNGFIDNNAIFFCLDSSRTFQDHFIGNGTQASPQYPNFGSFGATQPYALPSENSASFQEITDFGVTIPASRIQVDMSQVALDPPIGEGVTISPQISVGTDGTNFTDLDANASNVLGTNFRYVKVVFTLSASGNNDLIKVNNISQKLFLKQKTDQGSVDISASEAASGKQVSFFAGTTKAFLDVDSIALQIRGSSGTAKYAIYDFLDEPTPTGFKIFLFDEDGNAPTGTNTVDFTVRGV